MLTNLAGVREGTPDELEQFVAGRLDVHIQDAKPRIGDWTRVWGPAVYQAPQSHVADNVIYGNTGGDGIALSPNAQFSVELPIANSSRFVLPITIAPASRKRRMTVASNGER